MKESKFNPLAALRAVLISPLVTSFLLLEWIWGYVIVGIKFSDMELINILKWTGIVYMIFMCVQAIISTFEIHRKMQDMMSQEYMKENNISLMDKHEKKEHVKHEVFLMSCRSDKYLFTSLAVIRFSNFIASKFI